MQTRILSIKKWMLLALYKLTPEARPFFPRHRGCCAPIFGHATNMRHRPLRPMGCSSLPAPTSSVSRLPSLTPMSLNQPTVASSSSSSPSSNFQPIIDNALNTYKKRTKKDLREHPLAARLQTCDSPGAILAVLQEQAQELDQSRSADERWTKWLDPTVKVLHAFANILGAAGGPVCFRICTSMRFTSSFYVAGTPIHGRDLCRIRHPPFGVHP